MPYLDAERTIFLALDRASRKTPIDIPMITLQKSHVVIDANFKILKNRFGPHTDNKFIFMARNYMGEHKFNRVSLPEELFEL